MSSEICAVDKTKKNSDFEKKKRYLKKYSWTLKKIERLEMRKSELLANDNLSDHDKIMLNDLDYRLASLRLDAENQKLDIYDWIDNLDNYLEMEVLELFFIHDLDFKTIAGRLNYSERQVIRFYVNGVNQLEIE